MTERTALRLTLPGPFTGEDLGAGRWRLVGAAAAGAGAAGPSEVYLHVTAPGAAAVLGETGITRLDLDWRSSGVTVSVAGRRGMRHVTADSAIVHQPGNELYQALPLAGFDRNARRFWSRIFALMRIPGGRLLLRIIAKRRR
jgi:hypothetical protein